MFLNSEFCLARAAEARAEVDAARLDNVRSRYLAAENSLEPDGGASAAVVAKQDSR